MNYFATSVCKLKRSEGMSGMGILGMKRVGVFWGMVVGLVLIAWLGVHPSNAWELSMEGRTAQELNSISQLREKVEGELTNEYMHEDIYLLRWLIAKNWKVDQAAKQLREALKWRKKNDIDGILEEDWKEMEQHFPYQFNTTDKEGRPLLYFSIDQWDISKLSSREGSLSKLGRYFAKMVEETDLKIREMRSQGHSNISQFNLLINMKGYTMQRHGCFRCMAFYSGLGQTMEAHYPGSADKLMIVNAPPMFEAVYSYLKRGLNEKSRKSMSIYGPDPKKWEGQLKQFIQPENLPKDLY